MSREAKWMIRSGGRLVGPFEKDQILALLKSREISLRDEISAPCSRWHNLEFHPDFVDEVEYYKRELLSEKTEVSVTPNTSLTQTSTDLLDSELTEEITQDLGGFTTTKEIVVDNVQEEKTASAQGNLESAQYQLKGLDASPYVRGKSRKASLLIQAVAVILAVGVAFFLFLRFQNQRPAVEKLSLVQLRTVVLGMIERGDYHEALNLMKVRSSDVGFNPALGIYYALLSLQEEGQTISARRILEDVLQTQPDSQLRALTGYGLSYMMDQNYTEATRYFKKALAVDSDFMPARADQMINDYLQGADLSPAEWLSKPWVQSQGEALLTVALSALNLGNTASLNQISTALQAYIEKNSDFKPEASLLLNYIHWRGNPQSVDLSGWESLADQDPEMTELHRHNVFIYRNHLSWKTLFPFCEQMVKSVPPQTETQLLHILCLYKAEKFPQARKEAEDLVDKNPKNALGQAWYALTLRETGSPDQGSVALGRALEANRKQVYKLPLLLQGRFCANSHNYRCAEESWRNLQESDYNNLAALAGLAQVSFKQNNSLQGQKYLKRGLSLAPDYKPFLALKEEGKSQL